MGKRTNTAVWLENQERWQIKVQKDGVRRTFSSSTPGRTGQREANRKADEWLDENISHANVRVDKLFDDWMAEVKASTGSLHHMQYSGYGKCWIKKYIGHIKIGDVSEQHLQNVINAGNKAGLAKKTLNNIKACMTAFIKYARKCNMTRLYVENLTIPRTAKTGKREILQPADLIKLFSVDTTHLFGKTMFEPYIYAFRFAVATGLRPGELIGLKWTDVFDKNVTIGRSINRLGEVTSGKNDNAHRTFVMADGAASVLEQQRAMLRELGIHSDYVFTDKFGEYISQRNFYNRWEKYCAANGITKISPYEMRHTFVSIVKQLPEGLLKPLVGHSQSMDSFGTYSHAIDGDMESTANLVEAMLKKAMKTEVG